MALSPDQVFYKTLFVTRWSARVNDIKALYLSYHEITKVFLLIVEDECEKYATRSEAKNINDKLSN